METRIMNLARFMIPFQVQLRAMPTTPFLNQQDLQAFVASPDELIPERQANLTIEDIAAAYAPLPNILANSTEQPTSAASPDDSAPQPLITRTDLNQDLDVL